MKKQAYPYLFDQIDIEKIALDIIKTKIMKIKYDKSKQLVFQTPYLKVREVKNSTDKNHKILYLETKGSDIKKSTLFSIFIESFEAKLIKLIEESKLPIGQVRFKSIIQQKGDKDPYYRFTISTDEKDLLIDEQNKIFDLENLNDKYNVRLIVMIEGIFLHNTDLQIDYKVSRVMVNKEEKQVNYKYEFNDDDDEDYKYPIMTEMPTENRKNKNVEIPSQKTIEKQIEQPIQKTIVKQIEQPIQKTIEKQIETPVQKTIEKQVEISDEIVESFIINENPKNNKSLEFDLTDLIEDSDI